MTTVGSAAANYYFGTADQALFPSSGPATGSFNGINPKSKFLAFIVISW